MEEEERGKNPTKRTKEEKEGTQNEINKPPTNIKNKQNVRDNRTNVGPSV